MPVPDFEKASLAILEDLLEDYSAGLSDDAAPEPLTKAIKALSQLHQHETLKVIGEDEQTPQLHNAQYILEAHDVKLKNSLRAEQRTNLTNTRSEYNE